MFFGWCGAGKLEMKNKYKQTSQVLMDANQISHRGVWPGGTVWEILGNVLKIFPLSTSLEFSRNITEHKKLKISLKLEKIRMPDLKLPINSKSVSLGSANCPYRNVSRERKEESLNY